MGQRWLLSPTVVLLAAPACKVTTTVHHLQLEPSGTTKVTTSRPGEQDEAAAVVVQVAASPGRKVRGEGEGGGSSSMVEMRGPGGWGKSGSKSMGERGKKGERGKVGRGTTSMVSPQC